MNLRPRSTTIISNCMLACYAAWGVWTVSFYFDIQRIFFVHLFCTVLFGFYAAILWKDADRNVSVLLPLTLAMLTGPLGALLGLYISGLQFLFQKRWREDCSWLLSLERQFAESYSERIHSNLEVHERSSGKHKTVIPFLDIMEWGTLAEKQLVLNKIVRNFIPSFMPAIRKAFLDDCNLVRVQAASTIVAVEKLFMDEEMHLTEQLESGDDEEALRALAMLRIKKVESGILDPISERYTRSLSIAGYLSHIAMDPGDKAAKREVTRALIDAGQYRHALLLLSREFQANKEDFDDETLNLYSQCLFQLGAYGELRTFLSTLSSKGICPLPVQKFWNIGIQKEIPSELYG